MIPLWWLIIAAMLSGSAGVVLGAVCAVGGRADEEMEQFGTEAGKPKKVA
jgi:hypothetical protein